MKSYNNSQELDDEELINKINLTTDNSLGKLIDIINKQATDKNEAQQKIYYITIHKCWDELKKVENIVSTLEKIADSITKKAFIQMKKAFIQMKKEKYFDKMRNNIENDIPQRKQRITNKINTYRRIADSDD